MVNVAVCMVLVCVFGVCRGVGVLLAKENGLKVRDIVCLKRQRLRRRMRFGKPFRAKFPDHNYRL